MTIDMYHVPEAMRPYHAKRFREAYETVKRLDYDEWHRTQGSSQVRAQAELTRARAASTTSSSDSRASGCPTWAMR